MNSDNVEQLKQRIQQLEKTLEEISKEEVGRSFSDVVHGSNTHLPMVLWKLIDTPIFQRLRYVHQLGTMWFVFPNATHSRFEHSLGVAYLAGKWLKHFRRVQPELQISEREIHLVQIAGLLHDLGHGPFSHAFESGFIATLDSEKYNTEWEHEDASEELVRMLLKEFNDENPENQFASEEVDMVIDCIRGTIPSRKRDRAFLYQIVANKVNSIDVDKFDYLERDTGSIKMSHMFSMERLMKFSRVINGYICFRQGQEENIYMMFISRFNLHKQIYTHKVVVALDLMMGDILRLSDPVLRISDIFKRGTNIDYNRYLQLDDSIIRQIEISADPRLNKAKELVSRLRRRDLYKWIARYKIPDETSNKLMDELTKLLRNNGLTHPESDEDLFIVRKQKFNFALKSDNPMNHVRYYKDEDPHTAFEITLESVSELMVPRAEYKYLDIYVKDQNLREIASRILINYSKHLDVTWSPKVKSPRSLDKQKYEECPSPLGTVQRNLFQ